MLKRRMREFWNWEQSSVKRRLIFLSTLFWVGSFILIILSFLWVGQNQMLREAKGRNIQIASIVSADISSQMNSMLNDARTFTARLSALDPGLASQAAAMQALRIAAPQRYSGLYYFDTAGKLLLYSTDPPAQLILVQDAASLVSQPQVEVDLPTYTAFQMASFYGSYISDAYFTKLDKQPILYFSQKIAFGGTDRIVVVEISLQDIWGRVNMVTLGQSGYTYVTTSQGIVVAHRDASRMGERIPAAVEPLLSGVEGSASYVDEATGNRMLAAYSPVGAPTGWGVVVVQSESEMNATVVRTGAIIVGIWMLLAVIGTLSILFMVDRFTGPIAQLTRTANDVASTGELKKTALTSSRDEVGQLSRAFDNMMERLKTSEGRVATAASDERNRLARDLHDAVSQTLFSASIIADVLPKIWEKDQAEGRRRLEEVRQLTRGALAEMRMLLFELRPSALVEAELGYLVRQLAEGFTGRLRIPVSGNIQKECCLPADVKIAVYRIAQEALNNIAKHAGATVVRMDLSVSDNSLRMLVSDNGQGFDLQSAHPDSLGLKIMRDRAAEIGASISIKSAPGAGTEISVRWPAGGEE
jgi:signal transduction histidine kinase